MKLECNMELNLLKESPLLAIRDQVTHYCYFVSCTIRQIIFNCFMNFFNSESLLVTCFKRFAIEFKISFKNLLFFQ